MEAKHGKLTPNSFLKSINLIYMVILSGMMLFGSVVLFSTSPMDITMPSSDDSFLIAVPLFTFLGVVIGRVVYKRNLDFLIIEKSLKEKLLGFQKALIIKFILVGIPFLVGVVAVISSNNMFYMMISGTLVMYFMTLKPTKNKVIKDLDLKDELALQFKNGEEILN